jgi:hypothetical protein
MMERRVEFEKLPDVREEKLRISIAHPKVSTPHHTTATLSIDASIWAAVTTC